MSPKKYIMDELDKKFDKKPNLFKCDLVSDLKKKTINEVNVVLSEKRQGN